MSLRIGTGIGIGFGSAGQWSSYWAGRDISFSMSAAGFSLMVGQSLTIYGDSLIDVPLGNPLTVTYTCDIGSQTGNNYTIDPVVGDIGNHNLRIIFMNGSYTIADETIVISIAAEKTDGSMRVLRLGDSTMAGEEIGLILTNSLNGIQFTWIGTNGTTYLNEGDPGITIWEFATQSRSPFIFSGVMNIPKYFTDNSLRLPDIVYMRIGINDIANSGITVANAMGYLKTLVDAFLALNNFVKVLIALPNTSTSNLTKWQSNYPGTTPDAFNTKMHQFWVSVVSTYANGTYNARVDCSYEALSIDRDASMSNAVHPANDGYTELGNALIPYVNKNVLLGDELMPAISVWAAADFAWWTAHIDVCFTANGTQLICDGTGYLFRNAGLFTGGKTYRVEIEVVDYERGYAYFYNGNNYTGADPLIGNGKHIVNYVADITAGPLLSSFNWKGKIKDISFREVL